MVSLTGRFSSIDDMSRGAGGWLPGEESNLHQGIQSPLCYRCTTRHRCGSSLGNRPLPAIA